MPRCACLAITRHNQWLKTGFASSLLRENHHFASTYYAFPENLSLFNSHPLQRHSRYCVAQGRIHTVSLDSNVKAGLPLAGGLNERFRDLLSEAASYSIHDVASLEFESSVGSADGRSARLVERPEYQFDYGLWAILLRYRMLAYGDAGIKTIWKFMTRRDRLRLLPAHWPLEDTLWGIFVSLGLRDHEFLGVIGKHVKQLWRQRKIRRPSLYVEAIGGLLRSENSAAAPIFSEIMHPGATITSEELTELFAQAYKSASPMALEHFWHIYSSLNNHNIYGRVIPILCEQERVVEAMAMHSHLVCRRDCPATFAELEPLVRRIARGDYDLVAFTRQLEEVGVSFSARIKRLQDSIKSSEFGVSREDIDLATSKTFGVRRSNISDAFAARFFATKSFSFEFALNGLHMLGLVELGPLSLREIALHARTAALIRHRLAKVDSMGIDTGGSAYSRVIRTLAKERLDTVLLDVVDSDQHPDVFEDRQLQLQLLARYHQANDWRQFNRTLAVLDISGDSSKYAANTMLRGALIRNDWPEVTKITARMHQERSFVSIANIILMYRSILRPRVGKQLQGKTSCFQDPVYLITLWQNCLKSGTDIPSYAWREPLRRLGLMGRWRDLEKACVWLCSFYFPPNIPSVTGRFRTNHTLLLMEPCDRNRDCSSIVHGIFSPALQRAIVEWGFLAGFKGGRVIARTQAACAENSRMLSGTSWTCGIELLCNLRNRYGLCLDEAAIRSGCLERLRQLFSRQGRSKVWHNREARAMNKAKPQFYVTWMNKVYGRTLLDMADVQTRSYILKNKPGNIRWSRSTTQADSGQASVCSGERNGNEYSGSAGQRVTL